jgi:EAL domain-containing protein (putative c-di-GMP-specific phosphodiesterase class I)
VEARAAVNFSARTFRAADLVEQVRTVLADCELPADSLVIEITENLAMQNVEATAAVLADLKALGVGIAIDDFGTGYCSLAYLRRFPIDTLKIDASFTCLVATDPPTARIVAAVIQLAHSLGLAVVAEGVEDEAQWRVLREQGCDRVQGNLLSPPLPEDACRELLRAGVLPVAVGASG